MKNSKLTVTLIVLICVLVAALAIVLVVGLQDQKRDEEYLLLMSQADEQYEKGNLEEARDLYEEGTKLDPTRSRAWWGLANIYYVQGDVGTAVEVLYEATRQVTDEADKEEMTQSMNDMEDTLRYDANNPPAPVPEQENGEQTGPQGSADSSDGTAPDPDNDSGLATPGTEPDEGGEDEAPSGDPEEPEEQPADVTGISVNTELLDDVLSMKHSQLVETYGVAGAAVTDWGVMVLYQRCPVNFFYGYSYDGLVDTSTCIPYDNSFPTSAAFGPDAALITGQSGSTLTAAQLELLFGTEVTCEYSDMDGVWTVSVPYGRASLVFASDAEGNVDLNDLIWLYHLN